MLKRLLTLLFVYIPAGFVLLSILLVTILKWVPVTKTPLMIKRDIENIGGPHKQNQQKWIPLEEVSDDMIRAVIIAEDQKFLRHKGFDYEEFGRMKHEHLFDGSPIRGCSTISQQAAKNCFTFCSRTLLRKGIEAYYTVLIEKIWGKDRIMEVYLNVAEFGWKTYGIEAAAQRYYGIHASELSLAEASALACCLPNPLHRDPEWVNRHMASRRSIVASQAAQLILAENALHKTL